MIAADSRGTNPLFKIDENGVLSFMVSPNYEDPADTGVAQKTRTTSTELPCRLLTETQTSYFKVYVNVTDEEETGKVTWIGRPGWRCWRRTRSCGSGAASVPAWSVAGCERDRSRRRRYRSVQYLQAVLLMLRGSGTAVRR